MIVLGADQSAEVNVKSSGSDGVTWPSVASRLVTLKTTSVSGSASNTTVNVVVPPTSVVLPVAEVSSVNPAISSS